MVSVQCYGKECAHCNPIYFNMICWWVIVIKHILRKGKCILNGRVHFAGWLGLFCEVFIDVVHGWDDSGEVGCSMWEEFCPILQNLNDQKTSMNEEGYNEREKQWVCELCCLLCHITLNVSDNSFTRPHSSLFSSNLRKSFFKSEVNILIAFLYSSMNLSMS